MSPSEAALENQIADDELVDDIDLLSDDRG